MAVHKVMDHTGHSMYPFDPNNSVELAEAMERFNQKRAEGYIAAVKGKDGDSTLTKEFKATDEEVLFVPQLRGG